MSVKSQQVTKDAPAKRAQAAPAVTNRMRGSAGNHTAQRTQSPRETTEEHANKATQRLSTNEETEHRLQREVRNGGAESSTVPPIVHQVLRSPGQALDATTRAFMEPRFDRDFSQVRVHTDVRSAESARVVNALAYTVGQHIAFGLGQFQIRTSAGRELLAHELVHTVQQSTAKQPLPGNFEAAAIGHPVEHNAHQAASAVMQEQAFPQIANGPLALARQTALSTPPKAQTKQSDIKAEVKLVPDKESGKVKVFVNDLLIYEVHLPNAEGVKAESRWDASTQQWKIKISVTRGAKVERGPGATELGKLIPNAIIEVTDFSLPAGVPFLVQEQPFVAYAGLVDIPKTGDVVKKTSAYPRVSDTKPVSAAKAATPKHAYAEGSKKTTQDKTAPTTKAAIKESKGPDLNAIAQNVWDAMFDGLSLGTDEEKVYANLALLNKDKELIQRFEAFYLAKFGSDVVADIRSEFSENIWGGLELTKALSYLGVETTIGRAAKLAKQATKFLSEEVVPAASKNPALKGKEHAAYRILRAFSGNVVGIGFNGYVSFSEKGVVSKIVGPKILGGEVLFTAEDNEMVLSDMRKSREVLEAKTQLRALLNQTKDKRSLLGETYDNFEPMKAMIKGRNLQDEPKVEYVESVVKDAAGENITRALLGSFDLDYHVLRIDPNGKYAEVSFTVANNLTRSSLTHLPPMGGHYGASLLQDIPGQSIYMTVSFTEKIYFGDAKKKINEGTKK